MRIITTTPVSLLLALSASLSMAGSPAQNKSAKKKPRHVSNSSPAVGKLRARRVNAKSAGEQAPSSSEQPPVSDVVQSPNENSIEPTETKGEEEPGKPADSNASEAPSNRSGEKPAGDFKGALAARTNI